MTQARSHPAARFTSISSQWTKGTASLAKHLDVNNVMVTLGQKVKQGDVIVGGPSAECMLIENNRTDGERTGPTGRSYVPSVGTGAYKPVALS